MQLFANLASALTGPLAAVLGSLVIPAAVGLQITYLFARREGLPERLASRLGTATRSGPELLLAGATTGAMLGAAFLSVWIGVAAFTERRVALPAGVTMLVLAFAAGAVAVLLTRLRRTTGDPMELAGLALAGGWGALALVVVAAMVSAYADVCVTLVTGLAAGGLAGMGWLLLRDSVRPLLRHLLGRPLPAQAGFGAVALAGCGAGLTMAAAWLVAGGSTAPRWLALAVGVAHLTALPVSRRLAAVPDIRIDRADFAGYRTTVLELAGEGPPILFLHGFGVRAEVYRELMQRFGRHGSRLVAIDLPGVSEAADPLLDDEDLLPQLSRFARAAIEDLFPGGPPLVVGLSLGGWVTLDLVAAGVVTHAIVVGTAGVGQKGWMRVASSPPLVRVVSRAALRLPGSVRGAIAETVYVRTNPYTTELARATVRDRAGDPEALSWYVQGGGRLLRELGEREIDLRALPKASRVHFVWGELDPISPATLAKRVERRRPDYPITVMEGLPHVVFRPDPSAFETVMHESPVYAHYMRRRRRFPSRRPGGRKDAPGQVERRGPAAGVVPPSNSSTRERPSGRRSTTRRAAGVGGAIVGVAALAALGWVAARRARRRRSGSG